MDHWLLRPGTRRPDVQPILPSIVEAKAEEPKGLQCPGVVVGVLQDVPDKHLVQPVGVHTLSTRPLGRGRLATGGEPR